MKQSTAVSALALPYSIVWKLFEAMSKHATGFLKSIEEGSMVTLIDNFSSENSLISKVYG